MNLQAEIHREIPLQGPRDLAHPQAHAVVKIVQMIPFVTPENQAYQREMVF